jgi:hypothetical protein
MEIQSALPVEAVYEPPVNIHEAYQSIMDLRHFVFATTERTVGFFQGDPEYMGYDMPEEFLQGVPELQRINATGPMLAEALTEQAEAHQAIDGLLALQSICRVEPSLMPEISQPLKRFDALSTADLDTIIDGPDLDLTAKTLRLVCNRGMETLANFKKCGRYMPHLINLASKEGDGESKLLYREFVDALAVQVPNSARVPKTRWLFMTFTASLGYEPQIIRKALQDIASEKCDENWGRDNVEVMLALEQQESGLCLKITKMFGTYNFARYDPDMLADMYRQRLAHPELPYVKSFVSRKDHNFAYQESERRTALYRKLAKHGIRFEEHECATAFDVEGVIKNAQQLSDEHGAEVVDAVVKAHGSPASMELSDDADGQINRNELWCLAGLGPLIRKTGRIILASCSTGKQEGDDPCIAESVAQAAGRETIAPTRDVSHHLKLLGRNSASHLGVAYYLPDKKVGPFWVRRFTRASRLQASFRP